jgi:hypothetical protein
VTALSIAGTLNFDPTKDKLKGTDGKLYQRGCFERPTYQVDLYSGGPGLDLVWDNSYTDGGFCGFPHFFQASSGIIPKIRLQLLPSLFFPIHYSLMILKYDTVWSVVLTASLSKP